MLYHEVKELNQGLYVWLDPDEESVLAIQKLMRHAPFKTINSAETHCTVLHCREQLPTDIEIPKDKQIPAEVNFLDVWTDHKNRQIVVARLASDELTDLHAHLLGQGLAHSFPEYNPHINLAKDVVLDAHARLWLQQTNQRLQDEPLYLWFHPELKAVALD